MDNEVEYRDRDGKVYEQRIASINQVRERRDPLGHAVKYAYSVVDKITAITDPAGNTTRYDYDEKDRLCRVHRGCQLLEEYLFDTGGHFVEKRDGEGRTIFKATPHENHRVGVRVLSSGGFHRFDYDEGGRIIEATTELHQVRRRFDIAGRLQQDKRNGEGVEHFQSYASSGSVERTRLFSRFDQSRETSSADTTYLDEPNGQRTLIQSEDTGLVLRRCGNSTMELLHYDHEGLLRGRIAVKRTSDGALHCWSVKYTYSAEGDLLKVDDSLRGKTTYEVDDAHRLVGEVTPNGEHLAYDQDEAGNLLRKPGLLRAEVGLGNKLRASESETFTYNDRDALETRRSLDGTITRYVYDSFDMLVRVDRFNKAGAHEWSVEIEHDALGRVAVIRRGDESKEYYWDGHRVAAEVLPTGKVRLYNYAGAEALVPLSFTEYASKESDPKSGRTYYVFSDQAGAPLQIEDETGAIVWWTDRVDPYGHITVHKTSTLEYNLRWPGHVYDGWTGLHLNRYRVYDPKLGRYLQSDPIGHAGSEVNLYAYAANPLVDADVLGLAKCKLTGQPVRDGGDGDNDGRRGPPRVNSDAFRSGWDRIFGRGLREGMVMTYRDYKAARTKGSTLRGHHVPQARRLTQMGVDPDDGTVVVIENRRVDADGNSIGHTGTRTYGQRGSKSAAAESGQSLAHSEASDLADPPVQRLGPDVADAIRGMNRQNLPGHFPDD
jgi:RHS repeat-associated protein